jgi:hypothetical protein
MARWNVDGDGLTEQRAAFVAAYAGDQVSAAKAAGYRDPVKMGSRLMQDEAVKKAIEKKRIAAVAAVEVDVSLNGLVRFYAGVYGDPNQKIQYRMAAAKELAELQGFYSRDERKGEKRVKTPMRLSFSGVNLKNGQQ